MTDSEVKSDQCRGPTPFHNVHIATTVPRNDLEMINIHANTWYSDAEKMFASETRIAEIKTLEGFCGLPWHQGVLPHAATSYHMYLVNYHTFGGPLNPKVRKVENSLPVLRFRQFAYQIVAFSILTAPPGTTFCPPAKRFQTRASGIRETRLVDTYLSEVNTHTLIQ